MSEGGVEGSNPNLKQKVGRVAAAVGVLGASLFGVDKEAKPVSAAGHTSTPTPNAVATRIAADKTAIPGLRQRLAELDQLEKGAAERAQLEKQVKDRIDALTATPTPSLTPTWTAEQIRIKQEAGLLPTNTPTPRTVSTPTPVSGDKEGGFPWWGWLTILLSGAFLTLILLPERVRTRIGTLIRRVIHH